MALVDILGDIGYGYVDASNAASDMYQKSDRARVSGIGADRADQQYQADLAADMFNTQAAADRAKLEFSRTTNQLGVSGNNDKLDYYNPQTRQMVGDLARQYGGTDNPGFQRAYADMMAGRGMTQQADPAYQKAQAMQTAGQQVAAKLRLTAGYEDVHSVELGEDNKLYGFRGQPDETGAYDYVELPPAALREYAAYMGNTKLLGYDTRMQGMDNNARAAALGMVPGMQAPKAGPQQRDPAPITDAQKARNTIDLFRIGTSQGLEGEALQRFVISGLAAAGIMAPSSTAPNGPATVPQISQRPAAGAGSMFATPAARKAELRAVPAAPMQRPLPNVATPPFNPDFGQQYPIPIGIM